MAEWNAEREAALEKRLASARRESMVASIDTVDLIDKDLPDLLAHSTRQAEAIRGLVDAVCCYLAEHAVEEPHSDARIIRIATARDGIRIALAAARELREGE